MIGDYHSHGWCWGAGGLRSTQLHFTRDFSSADYRSDQKTEIVAVQRVLYMQQFNFACKSIEGDATILRDVLTVSRSMDVGDVDSGMAIKGIL